MESYPLFGLRLEDYDSLFSEKLDLLLKIRENTHVHWSGKHRAPLTGQAVYPRPLQNPLPIWIGVGGTPESFARAGMLGLPLMVAIIGGEPKRFRPLIDLYREAGRRAGHSAEKLIVGLHSIGFLGDTTQQAADDFYPGYAHTFTEIGKERGWPPTTRAQFDAVRGPTGALLIGDAETVAEKILYVNEALGGISRITFQMGVSTLPHQKMLRAIEILGTRVAPIVRRELAASPRACLIWSSQPNPPKSRLLVMRDPVSASSQPNPPKSRLLVMRDPVSGKTVWTTLIPVIWHRGGSVTSPQRERHVPEVRSRFSQFYPDMELRIFPFRHENDFSFL